MDEFLLTLKAHLSTLTRSYRLGEVAVGVLVLVLLVSLRAPERRKALGPLLLLGLHLLLLGLTELFPESLQVRELLAHSALFCLLLSLGRALFLLFTLAWSRLRSRPLPQIFLDVVQMLVYALALLITLWGAGVDAASLLTGSALVTAAVGLSLRDTLGNLFAGLAIQAQHPFDVGDWIQFDQHAQHIGRVVEINWRVTKVRTLDEVEIVVPNATLGQGHIVNFSRPQKWSRRSLYVHAPQDVPPQRVQRIILEALAGAWGVLEEPAPSVVTHAFEERGVLYWVRFFTAEFDRRDKVDGGARNRIWYALHRASIAIPGPRLAVRVEQAPAAADEGTGWARREQVLRGVDILEPLGDAVLARLARLARAWLYAEGEVLIRQGDPGEELFILQQGEVEVLLTAEGQSPLVVARLKAGSFFGEMSLLTGEPRSATVRAAGECEVLVIGREEFRQVLQEFPDVAERVAAVIAERQTRTADSIEAHRQGGTASMDGSNLLQRIKDLFRLR